MEQFTQLYGDSTQLSEDDIPPLQNILPVQLQLDPHGCIYTEQSQYTSNLYFKCHILCVIYNKK